MELLDRTAVIAELARRKKNLSGRLGKTAVMKLLHILQDGMGAPLGYRFSLYNYGPYNSEVMSDIDFAEAFGLISIEYLGEDQGYVLQATAAENQPALSAELDSKMDRLIQLFGGMNARELELRSTLLFLSREFRESKLIARLRDLKPKYSDAEANGAFHELSESGLVPK